MRWYADNSELKSIRGADIPDILLFGGIIIDTDAERQLLARIDDVKREHGYPRAPVKWNMKDLKNVYKRLDLPNAYQALIDTSRDWRKELFKAVAETECALLVACVEGYSSRREVLKKRKYDLTRYVFLDGLMRFGLHVKDKRPHLADVVLDWPDKGDSKPFDLEYACAYGRGKTSENNATYQCGKLSQLPFADSIMFSNMHHCQMLQIADLIVGATREFVECCMGKRDGGQGLDCLKMVKGKFRGAPTNIVGRGIVVPSGNTHLRTEVTRGIKSMLYGA